jgi:hypothetical protein
MATAPTGLPVVVQKAYEFSIWLIRKVENFPRSYRFSVGDRLVQGILDLLLRLVSGGPVCLVGRPILAAAAF